jgi:hypothetical protein
VKVSGVPREQCRTAVERAYDGHGEAFECVNPAFFAKPLVASPEFDLRDRL